VQPVLVKEVSNENEEEKTSIVALLKEFAEDSPMSELDRTLRAKAEEVYRDRGRDIDRTSPDFKALLEQTRRPNIILMKIDMPEQSNQEKSSFIIGGYASHRWFATNSNG